MIHVGIVGHRFLEQEITDFVIQECTNLLRHLQGEYGKIVALSAIAEGADSLFADVALSLDIPVKIVKPFEEYLTDFTNEKAKNEYLRLSNLAIDIHKLSHVNRSDDAYFDAMQWVVVNADIIFAVWNGKASNGRGGTANAVELAISMGKKWIHLDIVNQTVIVHYRTSSNQNLTSL